MVGQTRHAHIPQRWRSEPPANRQRDAGSAITQAALCWDKDRRQLWYAGTVLFTLHKAAPLEELILESFQELHWRSRIDDPLPIAHGKDRKQRLHNAIVRLNRHLQGEDLRFRRDGSGSGILWEMV